MTVTIAPANNVVRGVAWTILGLTCFLGMVVAVRHLSAHMSVFETLFFRCSVGLVIILPLIAPGGFRAIRSARPGLQSLRACVHLAAQYTWVLGVTALPLAAMTTLEFIIPLLVAIIAPLAVGERVGRYRWTAVLVGFAGVLVMLRPGVVVISTPAIVVIAGCFCFAAAGTIVKILMRTDSPMSVVFYMNVVQLPLSLSLALAATDWVNPVLDDVPWILIWGAGGVLAHYSMARALSLTDLTIVYPLDYLRLPFVAAIGWFTYRESVSIWTAAGATLIIGANWWMVRREARLARKRPAS